jgi:UDPglucose 6-dehydrogenase
MVGRKGSLARTVHESNQLRVKELSDLALSRHQSGMTVGVAGLSYKLNTDVTECSFGLDLVRTLLSRGASVAVYDPLVYATSKPVLAGQPAYCDSLQRCVDQSDIMVIANALPGLDEIRWPVKRPLTIVDCWRCLDPQSLPGSVTWLAVGRGDRACLPERFLTELQSLAVEQI